MTRNRILTLTFIAVILTSAVYLGVSFYNYASFYWTARGDLLSSYPGKVDTVHLVTDAITGEIDAVVGVSVFNPTEYDGLWVHSFQLTFFFDHNGNLTEDLFSDLTQVLLANHAPNTPLGPRSSINITLTAHLDSSKSAMFRSFNQTYKGEVSVHAFLLTVVNSFLDPVLGPININNEQEVRLT